MPRETPSRLSLLVVSPTPNLANLERSLPTGSQTSYALPPEVPSNLEDYDSVLLNCDLSLVDPLWLDAVAEQLPRGLHVVVVAHRGGLSHRDAPAWADVVGGIGAAEPKAGKEWFAKTPEVAAGLTSRLPPEFSVIGPFTPLESSQPWLTLASVNIAMSDRPALVTRRVDRGRITVSGLTLDATERSEPLARLVARSLTLRPWEDTTRALGVAIVGYGPFGGMGLAHGLAVTATPGLDLVAVVDANPTRRKAAESDFPGVKTYGDYSEILADDDVEVVIVATPPRSHVDISLALLGAGKHVACEKPLCFTAADADRLIAQASYSGVSLTVNQNRRWDRDFLAIRRAIADGDLGEVFNIETFVGGFEHPCRAWHSDEGVSGGTVYDWGSHHLDWILQLMPGAPQSVTGLGHKRVWYDVTNLDQMRVRLTWPDGREAEFIHSDIAAVRKPKFYVQGTDGTLVGHYRQRSFERIEPGRGFVVDVAHHAEAPADLEMSLYEPGYGLTRTELPLAPPDAFGFHTNLADHLHYGETLAVTPESVRQVIAVLEAASQSATDSGRPVTLEGRS